MWKLVALLAVLATPSWGQAMRSVTTTPDISVSATATADFVLQARPWHWISIKNDCSDTLYFNLDPTTRAALNYPLRLGPGESFTGPFVVYTIGASNDNASACTFTLQGAKN